MMLLDAKGRMYGQVSSCSDSRMAFAVSAGMPLSVTFASGTVGEKTNNDHAVATPLLPVMESPISVMLQLGEQAGQLCGAYMPAMVPSVPEFDDSETRLQWKFQNNRAQGTVNDELYIAFG